MGRGKSPWQDGHRAWERLGDWYQDNSSSAAERSPGGDGATAALADICQVRHLLDQAELVAVGTARHHGKSWAEIATKLGVTRQSAWERWRDLDEEAVQQPIGAGPTDTAIDAAIPELIERQARESRRRGKIVVPSVVGMSWEDARQALQKRRLVAVGPDQDGPPLAELTAGRVVADQVPEAGAKVPVGSPVTLWFEPRGGSAGVREPRRPKPAPRAAREMRYQPSDEAAGAI
jgi:hypothetical protein